MNQLTAIMRLITPAGLTALLLLSWASCQESEPETTAPGATEAASAVEPTPTPETAATATPAPTDRPIPLTATPEATAPPLPNATPESPSDFAVLHELLATIGSDTRLSDIFDALVESESACLREEIGGEVYGAIGGRPALVLVSSPLDLISAFCVEPQRKGDIIVAVMATAVSGLSGETEACIRNEIIENYGDDSSGSFLYGPSYLNCLNQTQIIELTVYELAWEAGNVGSETRDCMRQAMAAGFGAADRLSSGNPQDSLVITIAFQEVAIYGCLSTEQIAPFFGVEATDIPVIECLRYMYAERFPRLYNNVGAKMFGSGLDLSPKEQESLESFWDSRQECETDPPAYPTPKAPGPTLRPGVLAELRSTSIDENTSVGSVIALLPKDGAACLRDQLGSRLYSETAYERFLAAPAVSLYH